MSLQREEYFGFILIDKEKGISSHDAVFEVRRKLGCKVGHTGTLDPFATGLLVMALGKATRLADYIQKQEKEYDVEMTLGEARDSYDITGKVTDTAPFDNITEDQVKEAIEKFQGEIMQTPPSFSAVKVGGVRAYKLARKGKIVKIKERKVTIHSIEILEVSLPSIKLKVRCSTGTYIRSLAHDIGIELGTFGYAKELRRTAVGKYSVDDAITIGELLELNDVKITSRVISPIDAMGDYPQIILDDQQYDDISHGREIICPSEFQDLDSALAVFKNRLLALVNIIKKDDEVILKPDKVFTRHT